MSETDTTPGASPSIEPGTEPGTSPSTLPSPPKLAWRSLSNIKLSTVLVMLAVSLALYGDAVQIDTTLWLALMAIFWAATFVALIGYGAHLVNNSRARHQMAG